MAINVVTPRERSAARDLFTPDIIKNYTIKHKIAIMKRGFFAYGSKPEYCGETIEDAIEKINLSYKGIAEIKSWKSLNISGQLIISQILNEIDNSDFFCVDLTGLNNNVLFELGYAISKKKPIWILLDTSHQESFTKFQELGLFTTIGYSSYTNSSDIIKSFSEEKIYESEICLFDSMTKYINSTQGENALFYMKGQFDTNYSQDIINEIEYLKLPYIVDDPIESKVQPLTWYLERIFSTPALLVEFSSTMRRGYELHNSKCSFVAGISLGFGLSLLMITERPHPTPIDYRELLKKHNNRNECKNNIKPFLNSIHNDIAQLLVRKRARHKKREKASILQKINFGEYIAEHENENIFEYYIETSHFQNLIKSEHNIIIGRKGTGKTATFYYLESTLENDVRNHICLIKPINFEIDGLLSLHSNLKDEFERGFMIESIWKFLIYTEISKSLYKKIKIKPLYAISDNETKFLNFVKEHSNLILTDFSTRLEQVIKSLIKIKAESQGEYRIRVSEILHDNIIKELRGHIKRNIKNKGKLVVLIDNLDKSWKKDNNLNILSKYILGLLGVIGRISRDFKYQNKDDSDFSFHLTLFLRSDIFKYIMNIAREPDKIEFSRLLWNDRETLFRIIDARFEQLSEIKINGDDLWADYVTTSVNGINAKDYIFQSIFPRPRDLIFFLTSAKNIAVSRGHTKIEEDDIISAHKDYSNWVFKSILVENGISIEQLHDFMYNLMGENSILSKDDILKFAGRSNIIVDSTDKENYFINHLTSLTIIGREIKESTFEYEYEFDSDIKIKALAEKFNSNRFKVHNALIPYLEMTN